MGAAAPHNHASTSNRTRLLIAFIITVSIFVAQGVGAIVTGSLALLVDTAHMLTDSAGLLMALLAAGMMQRPATAKHSWGLKRTEVLSAMAQASLLFAVGMYALIEGVRRLFDAPEIQPTGLLIFGIIGLIANIAAMFVLTGGRNANLNMKAAFLEVVNDALGSVGVIISAIVIALFGWYQADAVVGILIALLIVPRTVILLKASVGLLLESTPPGIDPAEVLAHIMAMEHVTDVHDLHITRISSDLPVLTAHIIVEDSCFTDGHTADLLPALQQCVAEHFELSIEHSTFQIEPQSNVRQEHVRHH
ncbi:MAG: cation diffusion facilitator family transporter [Rhodoglobus sp.]